MFKVKTHVLLECDSGWKKFNLTGKCYKYSPLKTDRTEALRYCDAANVNPSTTLVSISNRETNDFLLILTRERTWIGGFRTDIEVVEWAWTAGTQWTFENWGPGEPNNDGGEEDFVQINYPSVGEWNDSIDGNDEMWGALCQYDPDYKGNSTISSIVHDLSKHIL